ncbi:MAG: HNH endonuclease signature motif containing protein [Candidatus Magasanikiibacteriota bacterium]
MQVEIISDTTQRFNGENYWICGFYFQRHGKRLHRAVWQYHNGEIPNGFHVHHKDGNRANNDIENLELLEGKAHEAMHGEKGDRSEWISAMHRGAKKWHGSKAGKQFHKEQYEKHCREAITKRIDLVCAQCGKHYQGVRGKFCSNNCKSAWRREHNIDLVSFICPVCGKTKMVPKYSHGETCSRVCGAILKRSRRSSNH